MRCTITIINRSEAERNAALGIEQEPETGLTDFWVKDEFIESFWIDALDGEIVFSVRGDDYRTAYTDALFKEFKAIIG